jgi:hypothetical protein
VSFFDGTTLLGSSAVSGGAAGLALFSPRVGLRSLTAVYSGDAKHFGSITPAQLERVVPTAAPALARITDVGGDQGHQVRVRLRASGFDYLGSSTPILSYDVYRKIVAGFAATPAGSPTFGATSFVPRSGARPARVQVDGWDLVGSVNARADSAYNIVVPTLADSNTSGINRTTFFVSAMTGTPGVYYDSAPDSGYSVDNLPPAVPASFAGVYTGGTEQLHWVPNTEPDLWYYKLYRGSSAGFVPGPGNLIATASDTGFVDPSASGSYYKLSAVDLDGNESGYALVSPGSTLGVNAGEPVAFALEGARPNPASGAQLHISFSLPSAEPATLELIDIGGRRVVARDVGALGAGRHQVNLSAGAPLAPGLYLVRLTQGARHGVTRVSVLE